MNINNIIVWAGAGISYDKPVGYPLGNGLTEYLLKNILKDDYDEFINEFKREIEVLKLNSNINYPRFETIVQIIKEIDDISKTDNVGQITKFFQTRSYNDNHFLISELVKNGAKVFTSNFDMCIENALACEKYNNQIHHFHGTCFDKSNTIGALIDNVKYLRPESLEFIKNEFKKDTIHIFVGYSMSDDLDINRLLLLENNCFGKEAIFVKHSLNCYEKDEPYCDDRISNLLSKAFSNTYLIEQNTTYALKSITDSKIIQSKNINKNNITSINLDIDVNIFKLFIYDRFGIKLKIELEKTLASENSYIQKLSKNYCMHRKFLYNNDNYIKSVAKLNDTFSDERVRHINHFLFEAIEKSLERGLDDNDIREIEKAISIAESIDVVQDQYRYYGTINRDLSVLHYLSGHLDDRYMKKAYEYYKSITDIDGIVTCKLFNFLINREADNKLKEFMSGIGDNHTKNKDFYDYIKLRLETFDNHV